MPGVIARVMLVDDHAMVRHGIAALIGAQADMEVFGEAAEVDAAVAMIKPDSCPDLVLVDLSLNGASGFELLKKLQIRFPLLPTLVVSMYDETEYAERALRAGARGYVMKQEAMDVLLIAIRQVLAGKIYLSQAMSSRLLERMAAGGAEPVPPVNRLTPAEFEVLHLIGAGHTSQEISNLLHRSIKTIEAHRASIRKKLQLTEGADLNRFATDWLRGQGEKPE
jgi:DNA-binding NarL/FixJ family response regulator